MPVHRKPGFASELCALEARAPQERIALLRLLASGDQLMKDSVGFIAAAEIHVSPAVTVHNAGNRWYLQPDHIHDIGGDRRMIDLGLLDGGTED